MDVSCHRPFLPGTSLEPAEIPTAQASDFTLQYFPYYVWCSKYSCFCSESIECFPGTVSKFFFKLLVTIPVVPIITGTIVHFRFHIRCISIHKLLYFNFFSASFCTTFLSAGFATSISVHVFSFLFLIIMSVLFAITALSVCTASFHNYYYYYYYYYCTKSHGTTYNFGSQASFCTANSMNLPFQKRELSSTLFECLLEIQVLLINFINKCSYVHFLHLD